MIQASFPRDELSYWLSNAEFSALGTMYTQTTKTDSVGCIYSIGKYSYIYVTEKQRSNEVESRGYMRDLREGKLRGAGGRKESEESDIILFNLKRF